MISAAEWQRHVGESDYRLSFAGFAGMAALSSPRNDLQTCPERQRLGIFSSRRTTRSNETELTLDLPLWLAGVARKRDIIRGSAFSQKPLAVT